MNLDWEIRKRSDICTRTQRPFCEGEFFHTAIFRQGDGFRREDVAEEAWAAGATDPAPFSFWRSKFELPPPPPPEALGKQDAESILRKLIKENSDGTRNARYILALMLERKRLLKPMESADPDVLVYERAQSGETFLIPNPHLNLSQVPEIQREVSALLGLQLGAEAQPETQAA
ncbi:MAG: hypothetical protein JHC52_00880 [Chthoniobacterales bacterium]|jgi:hypothetical protein|nr:hypothetical protein [Chthoniobacterales bacterium]